MLLMDFSELREAYREAEKAIRSVELVAKKVPVPALNEMRYAGYHAIALNLAESAAVREDEYRKVVAHCRRAYFDAHSMLLLLLYAEVKNIRDALGEYLHFFPEIVGDAYSAKKEAVVNARKFIENLHSLKQDQQRWAARDEMCAACRPHVEACKAYIDTYEAVREELSSRVDEAKRNRRSRIVTTLLSLLSILVAILIAVAAKACS